MKAILAAATIVLPGLAAIVPAAAQNDFVWYYSSYTDPDPFQSRLSLVYGLPETDSYQFNARCVIGANRTYATVEIGAEVGDSGDGTDVKVQFTGDGFRQTLDGTVVGQNAEVGVTGVEMAVELDDPLWDGLAGLSQLRYKVDGLSSLTLPLRGSSGPVGDFVDDCQTLGDPGEDQGNTRGDANSDDDEEDDADAEDNEGDAGDDDEDADDDRASNTGNEGETVSCDMFGRLASVTGGSETSVEFINDSDGYRNVMWLDYDGSPVPYSSLEQGAGYTQQTAVGHPWMITDGPGNCLEIYMPSADFRTFRITAPGQDFGAE